MLLLYSFLFAYCLEYNFEIFQFHLLIIFFSVVFYFLILETLKYIFGIEISPGLDSLNHYDLTQNRSHIVSCAIIHKKFDPIKVSNIIKKRAFMHPLYEKLKKVMKTKFFIDYWTYVDNFNIDDHIEIVSKPFKSYDDLYYFMTSHCSEIPFPANKPKWKIYLLINVFEGDSALIQKFHHAIGDGIAVMSYTFNLADTGNYKMVDLPKLKTWHRILLTPFGLLKTLYFTIFYLFQKRDNNSFKKVPLCGTKNGFGSLRFDMKQMKAYSKKLGVNLNDIILALINQSLRNCHQNTYNESLAEFKIFLAASLRGLPKPGDHFPLTNLTNFLTLSEFPHIKSTFENLIHEYHQILRSLKNNYDMYFRGFYVEFLAAIAPKSFSLILSNIVTDKSSCIFTSVPGPLQPITMFGYEIQDLFFFVNSPGLVAILINVFTYHDKLSVCCIADDSTGLKTKEFIGELEKLITNEILNNPLIK